MIAFMKGRCDLKKCYGCGSKKRVLLCLDQKHGKNTIKPLCLKCIKNKFMLEELIAWENKLTNLEKEIARQIVEEYFPNANHKKELEQKIIELMGKYTIRNVFQTCVNYRPLINTNGLENRCKIAVG